MSLAELWSKNIFFKTFSTITALCLLWESTPPPVRRDISKACTQQTSITAGASPPPLFQDPPIPSFLEQTLCSSSLKSSHNVSIFSSTPFISSLSLGEQHPPDLLPRSSSSPSQEYPEKLWEETHQNEGGLTENWWATGVWTTGKLKSSASMAPTLSIWN